MNTNKTDPQRGWLRLTEVGEGLVGYECVMCGLQIIPDTLPAALFAGRGQLTRAAVDIGLHMDGARIRHTCSVTASYSPNATVLYGERKEVPHD